jgi:putative transposase
MKEHKDIFPIRKMAKVLELSASGYYDWLKRPESKRNQENSKIVATIGTIQKKHRFRYGSPRITDNLRAIGFKIGKNRVARLLKQENLGAIIKKKYKHPKKCGREVIVENLLDRKFNVKEPNTVWVTDITYLPTNTGWAYLCSIIDLYNREIIGWTCERHMETSLVKKAFDKAWKTQKPTGKVIFHSDQGTQYTSNELKDHLEKTSPIIIRSMSRRGNCWDNAVAESFFKTLKRELYELWDNVSFDELKFLLFKYIDGYYNTQRSHSSLGYKTPLELRQAVAI